ncbi:MAG: metal-dependent hydrolase, partial [Planctomycetota bacterium]
FVLSTSLVAGGLCGVSVMLPDVDSYSGVPRREALGFAAAIVPMLLLDRFRQMGLAHDQMVLVAAVLYFSIRFLAADLIGRWSAHRGMWHSIPAVLIFAGLAFLASEPTNVFDRYLKAIAVGLGSFSHLVLDEVYSVDTRGVIPKFKKSFGSAIKFFGKKPMANVSTYTKLGAVTVAILMEPMVIDRLELRNPEFADRVRVAANRVDTLRDRVRGRLDSEPADDTVVAATTEPPIASSAPPRATQPSSWFAPPNGSNGSFRPNRSDGPQ